MNRLTRDGILIRALDMIDMPSLDAKDRPAGAIDAGALSIGWLQDGLDMFHNAFPWAGIVKSVGVTLATGVLPLPSDFIMDVRDGLLVTTPALRLGRWSLPRHIQAGLTQGSTTGRPQRYVVTPPTMLIWPTPDVSYAGTLWYYALPTVLSATSIPNFPSDWVLIEYVRFRGLEWGNRAPVGTAAEYTKQTISMLRRSGLTFEPEIDAIALDPDYYRYGGQNDYSWMGKTTL